VKKITSRMQMDFMEAAPLIKDLKALKLKRARFEDKYGNHPSRHERYSTIWCRARDIRMDIDVALWKLFESI